MECGGFPFWCLLSSWFSKVQPVAPVGKTYAIAVQGEGDAALEATSDVCLFFSHVATYANSEGRCEKNQLRELNWMPCSLLKIDDVVQSGLSK